MNCRFYFLPFFVAVCFNSNFFALQCLSSFLRRLVAVFFTQNVSSTFLLLATSSLLSNSSLPLCFSFLNIRFHEYNKMKNGFSLKYYKFVFLSQKLEQNRKILWIKSSVSAISLLSILVLTDLCSQQKLL